MLIEEDGKSRGEGGGGLLSENPIKLGEKMAESQQAWTEFSIILRQRTFAGVPTQ